MSEDINKEIINGKIPPHVETRAYGDSQQPEINPEKKGPVRAEYANLKLEADAGKKEAKTVLTTEQIMASTENPVSAQVREGLQNAEAGQKEALTALMHGDLNSEGGDLKKALNQILNASDATKN